MLCRSLDESVCRITCNDPNVPCGAENLVAKAWRCLTEAYPGRIGGLEVDLRKRIPAGAGLGGGSSDAAAALVAINRLYQLRLGPFELERHAAGLGSDCAFFIRGGTALGAGRGERLEPLPNHLTRVDLVVVFPGFTSPTAEAYGRLRPEHWENGQASTRAADALALGDATALRNATRNIFHDLAMTADGRYRELSERMEKEGLMHPLLSGSGSAMFAFARDSRHALQAGRSLQKAYPSVFHAQTRRGGVRIV